MGDKVIKIAGIAGSLRRESYNKYAIRAAQELFPENVVMDIIDLEGIPMFSEDVEAQGIPESVVNLKERLAGVDGILISTPEYNYSIPAVLKNALDWVSRGRNLPLYGKPLAIMSVSPSVLGGARVQYHLRQVCVALNLLPVNKPEVFISNAHIKFDKNGVLTDDITKKFMEELLEALIDKIKNINN